MARWPRIAVYAVLFSAWAAFEAWQYHAYRHECGLIDEAIHQQAHSVMNALTGGILSHGRLERFFELQLKGMLDELVKSEDVLMAAVAHRDGRLIMSAGNAALWDASPPNEFGEFWDQGGFRLVESFRLTPGSRAPRGGDGLGRGMGRGGGWWRRSEGEDAEGVFGDGGEFVAALVIDRSRSDALFRGAARSHMLVAAAGAIVVLCTAFLWRASVRLIEARGRAELLETESRHLREMGQAAAGLAHETRNPLGLIRGWTQRLVQSGAGSPEMRKQAEAVIEECDRVTARINQFLAFAKPSEPSLTTLDLEQLLRELAAILQPDLEAKNLQLQHSVPQRARKVFADRELLRAALFNLVQNAIHFSPEGDTVEVNVNSGRNDSCRIDVADHGPGVPGDVVTSLFSPYYTTRSDGAGLGLAIVRRIASAHGWEAVYAPREGGGAVFSLDGIHGRKAKDDSRG